MSFVIEHITNLNNFLSDIIWGPYTIALLIGTGIYFTIGTGFFQIRHIKYIYEKTLHTLFSKQKKSEANITPFQAMTTALASTVGIGNIVGVVTAISIGGPGAIFWMWVYAFFGMMTKYAEILLSIKYRIKNKKGEYKGGPMYYIERGLKSRPLALLFAFVGLISTFGTGNLTQTNAIANALKDVAGIPQVTTGIIVAIAVAMVIIGGMKRIATATEKIVPFMAVLYTICVFIVLFFNFENLPNAFGLIFNYAFQPIAAAGGFAGATFSTALKTGMSRSIFSNEAGLGSSPIAHASADTDHPVKQAVWGILEVFIDTLLMCTLTALAVLSTGVWLSADSSLSGVGVAINAFETGFGSAAGFIITSSIIFFGFSTLISWSLYGERCLEYLTGSNNYKLQYKILYIIAVVLGASVKLDLAWDIANTLNGFMAIPNLIALICLSGTVFKVTRDYFKNTEKELTFKSGF